MTTPTLGLMRSILIVAVPLAGLAVVVAVLSLLLGG